MYLLLRSAYLIAALLLLLIVPAGEAFAALAIFAMADLCAAALQRPRAAPGSVVPVGGDTASLALLRRTVPELRMRRPATIIEAQERWRLAAQTSRLRREFL